MTDNVAVLDGYTRELRVTTGDTERFLLVKPDVNTSERFRAWDTDAQEFIMLDPWGRCWGLTNRFAQVA